MRLVVAEGVLQELVAAAAAANTPAIALHLVEAAVEDPAGGEPLATVDGRRLLWSGQETFGIAWEAGESSVTLWAAGARSHLRAFAPGRVREKPAVAPERTVAAKRLAGYPGGDHHPVAHRLTTWRRSWGMPRHGTPAGDLELIEVGSGYRIAGRRFPALRLFVALDADRGDSSFEQAADDARALDRLERGARRLMRSRT